MDELIIGVISIILSSISHILLLWDPRYLYPLLPILSTISTIVWLIYSIMLN